MEEKNLERTTAKDEVLEIARELYKIYINADKMWSNEQIHILCGDNYAFEVLVTSDQHMTLSEVHRGNFDMIYKIVNAIPFFYLCKKLDIKLITQDYYNGHGYLAGILETPEDYNKTI